ncbi:MAG: hypothetical protein NVSMB20_12570 [Bradyrhizobium sp.]
MADCRGLVGHGANGRRRDRIVLVFRGGIGLLRAKLSSDLDRNLPPDLDHLIAGQAEEIADVNRVALHHGEDALLPGGKAPAVFARDDSLTTHI